jgi:hypothetical protein
MMYPMNAGIISGAMLVVLILSTTRVLAAARLAQLAERRRLRKVADAALRDAETGSANAEVLLSLPPDIQMNILTRRTQK